MKKIIPLFVMIAVVCSSCSHKYYTSSFFDQQTANHRIIAVLPSEIVLTGKQPKELTPEQIAKLEEDESVAFQRSLYGNILQYANSRRYYMSVGVQDINTTMNLLNEKDISIRDSWKMDDKKLAAVLGVDAIVRMQIRQKRYMSDYASYGVSVARNIFNETPLATRFPLPGNLSKTEDIYAYCSVVSNN